MFKEKIDFLRIENFGKIFEFRRNLVDLPRKLKFVKFRIFVVKCGKFQLIVILIVKIDLKGQKYINFHHKLQKITK